MSGSNAKTGITTVKAYINALNRHDLTGAGAFLADNTVMTFAGAGYEMDKTQILGSLGWDMGTKARYSYKILGTDKDEITIALTEKNSFLELLDVPPLQAEMKFAVNDKNLIRSIFYRASGPTAADPGAVERALEPVVEWARHHRPDELAEIYPNGQIHYSRSSAERWVAILLAWQEDQKE